MVLFFSFFLTISDFTHGFCSKSHLLLTTMNLIWVYTFCIDMFNIFNSMDAGSWKMRWLNPEQSFNVNHIYIFLHFYDLFYFFYYYYFVACSYFPISNPFMPIIFVLNFTIYNLNWTLHYHSIYHITCDVTYSRWLMQVYVSIARGVTIKMKYWYVNNTHVIII